MRDDIKPIYNEPLPERVGDIVPDFVKVSMESFPAIIKARLQIEALKNLCPVGLAPDTIQWTPVHKSVLTLMLKESDSPFSASLRTQVAGIAGAAGLSEAIDTLTSIFQDQKEDLNIRINSCISLLKLAEKGHSMNLEQVFEKESPFQLKLAAYRFGLRSENKGVKDKFSEELRREKNESLINILNGQYIPSKTKLQTKAKKRA